MTIKENDALSAYDERRIEDSLKALEVWHRAQEIVAAMRGIEKGSNYHLEWYRRLRALVPCGVYSLHKSTPVNPKLYTVLGVGDHSENPEEYLVTCSAHYKPFDQGELVHRPLLGPGGFLTPVFDGGLESELWKPRFKWVRLLLPDFKDFLAGTKG